MMFRTGNADGDTDPTVFLTKGKIFKTGCTNDFLLKYGAKPVSKIMANTNAFMDTETWEKLILNLWRYIER